MVPISRRTFLTSLPSVGAIGILSAQAWRRFGTRDAQPALKLYIERKETLRGTPHSDCMRGYLLTEVLGDKPEVACYVLELPPDNNLPLVSAIPAGTYPVTVRKDGDRGWRLELQQVPNRENVEIHVGNYPKNTVGCLLPGTQAPANDCVVLYSAVAMRKLQRLFAVFGQEYVTTVTIRDA